MRSGTREIQVTDTALGLSFPAWVQYPTNAAASSANAPIADGTFPVVLLSHGGGGSNLLYRTISTCLAQSGFIVALPEHPGNNRHNNALQGTDENLIRRTRHASLTIDSVIADPFFHAHAEQNCCAVIGHSIGGTTALALAGGHPWSKFGNVIPVTRDRRVQALVLLAPAAEWYSPEDSLQAVTQPILLLTGTKDSITPVWQAQLIVDRVPNPHRVTFQTIENAGHFSFLSPFPAEMRRPGFLPATDPEGFDREEFHTKLPQIIGAFLLQNLS